MNTTRHTSQPATESGQYRSLQILDELSSNEALTQRDISQRLGIALGLVNSFIKNLIAKGYVTVKAIPPKRYAYYLTPKGLAEKTRLAYDLLQDYTRIYREAKNGFNKLFRDLEQEGYRRVAFAGVDEVAEIAFITLHETTLELACVVDRENAGGRFFGREIMNLEVLGDKDYDCVVVASYMKREALYKDLLKQGVPEKDIRIIFKI